MEPNVEAILIIVIVVAFIISVILLGLWLLAIYWAPIVL